MWYDFFLLLNVLTKDVDVGLSSGFLDGDASKSEFQGVQDVQRGCGGVYAGEDAWIIGSMGDDMWSPCIICLVHSY